MGFMRFFLFFVFIFTSLSFAYSPERYDALLKTYVNDAGFVDYEAWQANAADLAALQSFVDEMASFDASALSGETELAFWINAYNALTLHSALERYPTDSIRPSFLGIPNLSFFKDEVHVVSGETFSLDAIENNVIRPLGDPRIHFAINCASFSCPALLDEVYSAAKLDAQLNAQGVRFVNDSERNSFDTANNKAELSKIFNWFKTDFDAVGGVSNFLAQFAQNNAKTVLESGPSITYLEYDWALNKQ